MDIFSLSYSINGTGVITGGELSFTESIAELPFFAQFEIKDKNRLIEELEAVNKNREQNSIYDIVKGKTGLNGSTLNINGQNVEATDTIKKEKKNCKC